MTNPLEPEPRMSDVERLESLNLTLVAMLEKCLLSGDHEEADNLLHHITWNEVSRDIRN